MSPTRGRASAQADSNVVPLIPGEFETIERLERIVANRKDALIACCNAADFSERFNAERALIENLEAKIERRMHALANGGSGESYIDWDALDEQRQRRSNSNGSAPNRGPRYPESAPTTPIGPALSAEALKTMTFAPIKYVVPGVLVEGVTLFAGKPKIGKSWLLLHAALAVARGGFTLGDIHCVEGDVLYCALEDNERRLQSRITKLLGFSQSWPSRFFYHCKLPRLGNGGLDAIRDWIKSKPHPRLVVIDTLAMVRAPKKRDETNYDADYASVLELRQLANESGVAIVLVHHLRKADADDAFDTISGTLGLTGAPDTVLVLKRDATGTFILHGRGRDLVEIEKAMAFDGEACIWRVSGDAAAARRSRERSAVIEAIDEAGPEPVGPNDIASVTGMKSGNVRRLLGKLVKEGIVEKAGYGRYQRSAKGS